MTETCCVADQHCTAAANFEPLVPARGRCACCGEAVCAECSSRRHYQGELARLCNDCQVEIDGDNAVVLRRLHRQSGYKVTLAEMRAHYLYERR